MCGILGITGYSPVNQELLAGLTVTQHRGQDAAGIMTSDAQSVYLRKGNGLVREAISPKHMLFLKGHVGIGHVRYPTAGTGGAAESQPIYVNSPCGLAMVHNGNLINAEQLRKELTQHQGRHLNTDSDSEVLLNVFAYELQKIKPDDQSITPEAIFKAVTKVNERCKGAYSVVILIVGYGLVAFRDPYGIRPLVYGKRNSQNGGAEEYMFASESVALDALNFGMIDDVLPGTAICVESANNTCHYGICADTKNIAHNPCIFEYVYLARPDSIINQVSVYQARVNMGEKLAKRILASSFYPEIDLVVPIPDTSRIAALPLAEQLNRPYCEGLIKNRYVGRTFIMPGQVTRRKSVQQKLNPVPEKLKGKNILLIDDSIVRGTTSRKVIELVRKAGARKVFFASLSPMVSYPNTYGIDMPAAQELVAHGKTKEEIAEAIGADGLIYQELSDLYAAIKAINPNLHQFEDCIFTGRYVAGNIDKNYLDQLAKKRRQKIRSPQKFLDDDGRIVEVYNT